MTSYTPKTWAEALLGRLGVPVTNANTQALVAWEAAEGGNWHNSAAYNPLNTTQDAPGASSMNSVGVKRYTSWGQGLDATVATLTNGRYSSILDALRAGNDPNAVAAAVVDSPWGTHNISIAGGRNYTAPATSDDGASTEAVSSSSGSSSTPWYDWLDPRTWVSKGASAAGDGLAAAGTAIFDDFKGFATLTAVGLLGLALVGVGVTILAKPAIDTARAKLPPIIPSAGDLPIPMEV